VSQADPENQSNGHLGHNFHVNLGGGALKVNQLNDLSDYSSRIRFCKKIKVILTGK
jgi:hypothetical protein